MFPIPDAWAAFYLTCFVVGFVFVGLSLFLGFGHDATNMDGGGHFDGGHVDAGHMGAGLDHAGGLGAGTNGQGGPADLPGGAGAPQAPAHGMSPFNLSTIMAFVTWFGGAGYILRAYAGIPGMIAVAGATLAGLAGGTLVFYFLVKVLLPGQRILNPRDYQMVGTVARVTMPIGPALTGEVMYSKGGSRRSDGARSADGTAIGHGTEVVIVRYEKGIAYVEPWSSYVARG